MTHTSFQAKRRKNAENDSQTTGTMATEQVSGQFTDGAQLHYPKLCIIIRLWQLDWDLF